MANASEKQLKEFVKSQKGLIVNIRLRTQGMESIIHKEAINLCEVISKDNRFSGFERKYSFGGISEDFYDKINSKWMNSIE